MSSEPNAAMGDQDEIEIALRHFEAAGEHLASLRFAEAIADAMTAANCFMAVDGPHSPDGANALMAAAEACTNRQAAGDLDEAVTLYQQAGAMLGELSDDRPGGPIDTLLLRARRGTGDASCRAGRYDDATLALEAAMTLAEERFGPESQEVGLVANDLGVLGKFSGNFDDAERWYRRSLMVIEAAGGARSIDAATLHHNLAGLAHARLRSEDGLASGRLSVAIRRERLGDDHVDVAADRANLGGLLMDVGAIDEAEACFEAARTTFERAFGPDHLEVAVAWHNLGAVAVERGLPEQAIACYRRALASKSHLLGDAHPSSLLTAVNLAYSLRDDVEAVALLERAVAGLTGVVSEQHRTLTAARLGLADRRHGDT